MATRNSLTAERLRKLLHYDPETGVFTHKTKRGKKRAGSIAGCFDHEGYRAIGVDYCTQRAPRLAWLYMTGSWPKGEIDHKNRIRSDDRWSNLRDASHHQNGVNKHVARPSSSGYRGVVFVETSGKWLAKVIVSKKQFYFGTHETPIDAAKAYDKAVKQLHGQYARLNFPEPIEDSPRPLRR